MSSVALWTLGPYLTVEPEGGGGVEPPRILRSAMRRRDWERRLEIERAITRALEATENVIRRRDRGLASGGVHRPVRGRPVLDERPGPPMTETTLKEEDTDAR